MQRDAPMDRWTGRVALVTGASSGIGATVARLLVQSGMRVVGAARRIDKLQAMVLELQGCKGEMHAVQCDVTKEHDVIRAVQWTRENLGGADVLVNAAGVYFEFPLSDLDAIKFRTILEVNVLGLSVFTREVIRDMRQRNVDDGHIFHIGSVSAHRTINFPGAVAYSASKHAVRVMTEGLRKELRDTKIKVTEVSPGTVRTGLLVTAGILNIEEAAQNYATHPCLETDDVARALLYALTTPPHVQVHEIIIQPVGQA